MRQLVDGTAPGQSLEEELAEIELMCEQRNYRGAQEIAQRLLRANPTSARVHEAMGDVAGASHNHQEAVQWYELTLQLGFDQRVMDKLSEQRRLQSEAETARTPAIPEETETEPHYRMIAAIAGVVVLAVVVGFLIMSARGAGRKELPTGPPSQRAVVNRPTPPAPGATGAPATAAPAVPAQPDQRSYGEPAPTPVTPGAQAPSQALPPVNITRAIDAPLTDQDRSLLSALSSLSWPNGQSLSGDVNVMVDPYTGYAFITLKLPSALKDSTMFSTGLNMAYSSAVAAIKADRSLRSLTIRLVATVTTEDRQVMLTVFRGNTNRLTLERHIEAGTTPDTRKIWEEVFATSWWNPSVPVEKSL